LQELRQQLREDAARQVALQDQQQVAIEQLMAAVRQLHRQLDELVSNGTNQDPGLSYATSQQAMVIEAETADHSRQWPGSAWEKIKRVLARALKRLWSMISKLVRVKEWTLSGKIGTPGRFLV
jgi:hypothetical protein